MIKKRIYELEAKNQIASKRMNDILEDLNTKKRSIADKESDKESKEWNTLDEEIKLNLGEIKTLKRQLEVNDFTGKVQTVNIKTKKERTLRDYSFDNVITGIKSGNLNGYEAEQHKELERTWKGEVKGVLVPLAHLRAAFTVNDNSQHITDVSKPVDIVSNTGMLAKTGWRTETLINKQKLSYGDGFTAAFVAEGDNIAEQTQNEKTANLTPKRVGGYKDFSKEYLSVSQSTGKLYEDMVQAVERAIVIKGITDMAVSGNTLAGYLASSTAILPDFKKINKLKGAVNTPALVNPRFYAGNTIFSEMEATDKSTSSGRFIIENNKLAGLDVINMGNLMGVHDTTKYDLLYADASRIIAAMFGNGAVDVLIDPFTQGLGGEIRVIINALADVAYNPDAIKLIRNLKTT